MNGTSAQGSPLCPWVNRGTLATGARPRVGGSALRCALRIGAPGPTRTGTSLRITDFESVASTGSATGAALPTHQRRRGARTILSGLAPSTRRVAALRSSTGPVGEASLTARFLRDPEPYCCRLRGHARLGVGLGGCSIGITSGIRRGAFRNPLLRSSRAVRGARRSGSAGQPARRTAGRAARSVRSSYTCRGRASCRTSPP